MHINDLSLEQEVRAQNSFGLTYFVTKISNNSVTLEHRTGDKVMRGGKWVDEVYRYAGVSPKILSPVKH